MKSIVIIVLVVLVIGGGVWLFMGTEWDGEVLDREETREEELTRMEEIEMEEAELMEILARAEGVASLSYDIEMESPDVTMDGNFWQKGQKMRIEGEIRGEEMVVIVDNEEKVAYTYMPAQNIAVKLGLSEVEEVQGGSIKEQSAELPENQPVVIGVTTIEGKECIVVEYFVDEETTGKMWIWREHGLPIRVEIDNMVMRATNIDFGEVSDDKFELPAGVEPMEIPTDAPLEIPAEGFDIDDFDVEVPDIDGLDINF